MQLERKGVNDSIHMKNSLPIMNRKEILLIAVAMTTIKRIKEFFTKLKQEYNRVFNQGLAKTLIESGNQQMSKKNSLMQIKQTEMYFTVFTKTS